MRQFTLIVALLLLQPAWSDDELPSSPASVEFALKKGEYQKVLSAMAEKDELTEWYDMFLYGTALLMAGQLVDAAEVLDTAISLQGDVSELWTQRAIVEQEQGHPETALRLLKVALELNPNSEIALLNAGYAYESLGRPEDARVAYSEYLRASSGKLAHVKPRRHIIEKLAATP